MSHLRLVITSAAAPVVADLTAPEARALFRAGEMLACVMDDNGLAATGGCALFTGIASLRTALLAAGEEL